MDDMFDTVIDRRNTNSAKVDEQDRKYGSSDMIHLGVADMDFRSPEPVIRAMKEIADRGVFGYTVLPEDYEQLVCRFMERRYGVSVQPEWVVFSPRINMALNMAVETFTEPGDGIVLHTPAYTALQNAILQYGRTMIESPLTPLPDPETGQLRYRMDLSSLRARLDQEKAKGTPVSMLLFCNPQNPTGRVWTRKELSELADLCCQYRLLLVSDEIHSDFIRPGHEFVSLLEFSGQLKHGLIVCNSLTKTLNVPGLIFSDLIIPDRRIREAMKRTIDRWGLHNPNIFAAGVLRAAYAECDGWICQVNRYLEENRQYVTRFFETFLPGFQVMESEGTYLLWISTEGLHRTPEEVEEFFDRWAKVSVYMGSRYGLLTRNYIRLNLASPRPVLSEAMERIRAAYCEWLPAARPLGQTPAGPDLSCEEDQTV